MDIGTHYTNSENVQKRSHAAMHHEWATTHFSNALSVINTGKKT